MYPLFEMENIYIKIIRELHEIAQAQLTAAADLNDDNAKKLISDMTFSYIQTHDLNSYFDYQQIKNIIEKIYLKTRSKLNILKPLIDDKEVSEIMVNGSDKIFYERKGEIYTYKYSFDSEEEVEEVMQAIASQVNREINELNPILDARLPDGSRVNAVYKNVAVTGPTITIRKFLDKAISIEQLVNNGTLTEQAAYLLMAYVKCGYNIFISGGTSSGKTTLINALSEYIDEDQRVIVIEDSAELKLKGICNLVQMECRNSNSYGKGKVSMSDLLKTSLRMRPDRLIVGEIRGEEAFDMLQAMNTGHSGMCTGHGNSTMGMLKRLETMYLQAVSIDTDAIRRQIAEGIEIMVHVERKGKVRKVVEISEILGYENGEFKLNSLMHIKDGYLAYTGNSIENINKLLQKGEEYISGLQINGFICK